MRLIYMAGMLLFLGSVQVAPIQYNFTINNLFEKQLFLVDTTGGRAVTELPIIESVYNNGVTITA
jgi:hypothetical protein